LAGDTVYFLGDVVVLAGQVGQLSATDAALIIL
jgi:hypothetical protein